MTQVERTVRMIEMGYFDFFGLGTDLREAERALDAAVRIDLAAENQSAQAAPAREDRQP